MKTSTAAFRLPDPPQPRRVQWPAFAFIAAITATSLIALSPAINERWSQISYPVVANIDQTLLDYGIAIGPAPASDVVSTQPVIAVVFGCISADDDEPEFEQRPPSEIELEKPLPSMIRPATFQTSRPRETSEAQELSN